VQVFTEELRRLATDPEIHTLLIQLSCRQALVNSIVDVKMTRWYRFCSCNFITI